MGTTTDLRITVSASSGATGFTTVASARPRVQDTKLHMVATKVINVWPSSLSGPWSG